MRGRGGLLAVVGVWLLACGGVADMASQRASEAIEEELAEQMVGMALGGDVELSDDGSLTLTADGVKLTAGGDQEVPEDFPYPPPDGMTVSGVSVVEADGKRVVGVMVADPTGKIAFDTDLEERLKAEGWTESAKSTMEAGDAKIFSYAAEKGDETFSVHFQISPEGSAGMWSWSAPLAP